MGMSSPLIATVPVEIDTSTYQTEADTTYYVTIEFYEWEQRETGHPCDRVLEQLPWIRLQPLSEYNADKAVAVILARVTIDSEGRITQLEAAGRRLVGKSLENLEIRRSISADSKVTQVKAEKFVPKITAVCKLPYPILKMNS